MNNSSELKFDRKLLKSTIGKNFSIPISKRKKVVVEEIDTNFDEYYQKDFQNKENQWSEKFAIHNSIPSLAKLSQTSENRILFKISSDEKNSHQVPLNQLTLWNEQEVERKITEKKILRSSNRYLWKQETSLNLSSAPYTPNSKLQSPIEVIKKKEQMNLNWTETIVLNKLDLDTSDWSNQNISKSGRIPNEMKYKTELWKNFLVGK